ncbi:gliding motility-associated C-terminal domain-containing protein [Flavobacterium psychrotrophum]|uniref:T9SS type B sorting domain-containing protein n=1 Tax=Flavobacterium psychrotrophum TaxID=2294119 RepID=UPI000E30E3DB|nr:gliding motility-associated C-terminal domain-containing protein [Flavobacterium psychrotrophum]
MSKKYHLLTSFILKPVRAFVVISLLGGTTVFAQAPGGVSGGLTGWFRSTSNAGTANTNPILLNNTTDNRVTSWMSSGGTTSGSYALVQSNTTRMPVYTTGNTASANFNFNPFMQFSGSNNTLLTNTSFTTDLLNTQGSIFLVVNTYTNITPKNTALTYLFSQNKWQFKPGFRTQTGDGFAGSTGDYYNDAPFPGGVGMTNYPETAGIILMGKGVNTNSTSNTFSANRNGDTASVTNNFDSVYDPAVSSGFFLGSNNGNEIFNGAIAEVITFDVNLSDADVNKVESYLAVKYGVTLTSGQSSTNRNYTAPDGSVFWTADNTFKFNVTGIGRDDVSGLYQKQSKSIHNNNLITVYNKNTAGTFPVTNALNTTAIDATASYFITADNGLGNATVQGNCVNRIARTWKVQKTGGIADVTIAAAKSQLPADVRYLVVSSDPTFPAGDITTYPLDDTGTILYKNVNIPTGYYFTYGSEHVVSNAVTIGCNTSTTTVTSTGLGTWTADSANPSATVIANPTANSTLISGFSTPGVYTYNWGSASCFKTVTITYTGAVPAIPVVTDIAYCQGQIAAPLTATALTGYTLTWVDSNGIQLPGAPTPLTSAIGTATFNVYQTSPEGCQSLDATITVTINTPTTAVTGFTLPAAVCAGAANVVPTKDAGFTEGGAFTVTPATGLAINAATGEIDLATSTPGTYNVKYEVTTDVTNCITGDDTTVTILINSAPVLLEPSSLALCDDDYDGLAVFNLEAEGNNTLNGQTGITLTYHTSLTDAEAGTAAITTPAAYSTITPNTQTVYIRAIENGTTTNCYTIKTIVLTVNPKPVVPVMTTYALCDDPATTGVQAVFNLTTKDAQAANGVAGLTVSYYTGETEANDGTRPITGTSAYQSAGGTVWVRVQSAAGCYSLATLNLQVNPLPATPGLTNYVLCDDPATTGVQAVFNLNSKDAEATNGVAGLTVSYYDTEAAANAGTTPVATPATYTSGTATIWVRVQTAAGCYSVASLALIVNPLPVANTIADYQLCEVTTGVAAFNLSSRDALILPAGSTDTVTYFTSQSNADNNTGAITTPGSYNNTANPQTIYVRVGNGGCYTTTSFILNVLPAPQFAAALELTGCSPFNLTEVAAQAGTGVTLGYFATQADALANNNAIATPASYLLTTTTGIVYVRAENAAGCTTVEELALTTGNCEIQRGISPGGTIGQNDNFDLAYLDVRKISIYNRYGLEVYSFKGSYTNQWGGQGSNGDELPTGTYFYMFERNNGESKTGWIYINRQN